MMDTIPRELLQEILKDPVTCLYVAPVNRYFLDLSQASIAASMIRADDKTRIPGIGLHSVNDEPAKVCIRKPVHSIHLHNGREDPYKHSSNVQVWYHLGKRHRGRDKPAVVSTNGYAWYEHGKEHRDGDLPAVICCTCKRPNCFVATTHMDQLQLVNPTACVVKFIWKKNGVVTRDNGLPAIINYTTGECEYIVNGKYYRADGGPTKIVCRIHNLVRYEVWCNEEGRMHRDNGPAIIGDNGTKCWLTNGKYCNDGPAVTTGTSTIWMKHISSRHQSGQYHRDNDLPAYVDTDGTQEWYWYGNLHRNDDKPAIMRPDGTMEWYFHGTCYRVVSSRPPNDTWKQCDKHNIYIYDYEAYCKKIKGIKHSCNLA